MINLQEKKKLLEELIQQKANVLQQIEDKRNQLTTELVEIRGKINLLNELLNEEKAEEPKA